MIAAARRGWIAAGIGGVLAVLGFSMATFQSLRPPPAPYPVVVDRTTGETSVVATLDASNVPALAALDQHNAADAARLERDGKGRPRELLLQPRGDEANHAGMPAFGRRDDDGALVLQA